MSLIIHFYPANFTHSKYEAVHQRLREVGSHSPKGRQYHVAFSVGDDVEVIDVWRSKEDFDAFGAVLMPILNDLGVTMPRMEIEETLGTCDEAGNLELIRDPVRG